MRSVPAILLLAACVVRFPVDDYRMLMGFLAMVATILCVAIMAWEINPWVGGFLALCCWSSLFPFYSLESREALFAVLFGTLWYLAVCRLQPCGLYDVMCIIALANIAILICQVNGWAPERGWLHVVLAGGSGKSHVGLMGNQNEAGAILAFCLPAFFRPGWRPLVVLVLLGLCLSASFGPILSVAAGCIAGLCLLGKWRWTLVAGLVSCLYLFVDTPGITARAQAWGKAWEMYLTHWVFGGGLGHFKVQFPAIENVPGMFLRWIYLHNEFLQGLFELGAGFGVIVFGYAVTCWRRYSGQVLPAIALIIIAVNCMVNFPFHIGSTGLIAVTWMAMFEVESNDFSVPNADRS